MHGDSRWHENWRLVAPDASLCIDVGRSRWDGGRAARLAHSLPAGARVVLRAAGPGAHRRCTRLARDSGLETERTYLAFPTARAPAYLVERTAPPLAFFTGSILTTPPGLRFGSVVDLLLDLLRRFGAWRIVGALAPGCVVVGRRP